MERQLRRGPATRIGTLAVLLVGFGGLSASPAAAVSEWRPAQPLSTEESNGEVPQVAIADDGSAVAVWRFHDPDAGPPEDRGRHRVEAAFRKRGENFSGKKFLSSADRNVGSHIRLKMNKRGDAVVVWEVDEGNGRVGIRSAYKPAGGGFGDEEVVENGGVFVEPEVGIDGNGAATVIYHPRPRPFGDVSQSSIYASKSRAPGAGQAWGDLKYNFASHDVGKKEFPIHHNERHGSLAVNEQGDRFVVFASQSEGGPGGEREVVINARRDAGEADWRKTSEFDTSGPDQEVTSTHIEYSRDGKGAVGAHSEGSDLYASHRRGPVRINPPFDGPGPNRLGAAFAVDATHDALALWSDDGALRAATSPDREGPFEPPDGDPIPGNAAGVTRTRPALTAPDGNDTAVAVFNQREEDAKGGFVERVQAAVRPPGATKFDAPVPLSAPGDLEEDEGTKTATGPKVAMNSSGEAVAAWSRKDEGGDAVVEVALYGPIDDPKIPVPPPPPPRPKPAVPNPIQLARPLARDMAVVLIANIPGDIRELQWSFGSENEPPIVGKVEGGQLQRTVRLRLPNRSFRAKVRAVAADGSTQSYSRAFTALKPSSSSEARDVAAGLQKANPPPVFAVGDRETLTARSDACAPTTIWSGQQKTEGCFKPLEKLGGIPAPELGAVQPLAEELGLDVTRTQLMDKATQMTDGYVARGRALLNDKFPVTPSGGGNVVSLPQAKALISAKAELPVGGASFDPQNGFNLRLDPKKANIPLGKLPKPPKLPSLAGLEIVGDWNVDLEKQEAKIKASVKFPPAIKKAGVQLSNEVILRATPERVIVDEVRVGPIDVNITALKVQKFQIQYKREPDQWDGQGQACIVLACLDMIPPNGGVTIKRGDLERAGATLQFPGPGIPLFAGVNLERVGFGVGLRPTRIFGSARVGVAQILKLDGRVFVAMPDSQNPFVFDRKEVGNAYPDRFYGQRFTRPTFGASAEAFVNVPVIGETRLGNAYALYEFPSYAAFGGAYRADVLGIVSLSGGVDAEADFDAGLFNIHGSVRACIHVIDDICEGATGNVSRGRGGTGGAGACVQLGPLSIGGGVQWQRISEPFIWPFDGCKWSRFRATVRGGAVSARSSGPGARKAAGPYTMTVEPGKPSPAIQLSGAGAAPTISVRGPGGQFLQAGPGQGFARSSDNSIRVLRFENRQAKLAVIGLQNARPGTYTVQTLPGSAGVTSLKQASDPPAAKVSGRVTGKGRRRVLRYDVRGREGQKVTFQEIAAGGAAKTIGSTTSGGRGSIRFRPAPGGRRRKVFAQFELSGIPAERKFVTSFRPESSQLKRPRRLRVRRRGSRLVVSWRKVAGTTRYEVAASLGSRRMVFKTTRRRRVSLRVARWQSGRVFVRAVEGDLRQSRPARSRRFRGRGRQPSPFRPLLNCRIVGPRIICAPRGFRCGGRVPTISASPGRRTRGTNRADVIVGTSSRDRIDGRGGDDIICAGAGNDRITGGRGSDRLEAGAGRDRIHGRSGDDRLDGGSGSDRLKGGLGDDDIAGGGGDDVVVGGEGRGRDTIDAGAGDDRVETRDRGVPDRVDCGPGRDRARLDRVDRGARCEGVRFR